MKSLILLGLIFTFSHSSVAKEEKKKVENIELFSKVLHLVEKHYYTEVEREKLLNGALKGMMQTLDPHSNYLNKDLFEQLKNDTDGSFGGIGIEVTQRGARIIVVTPIENSPADKAGIKEGDEIVQVNDVLTLGKNLDDVIKLFKGKNGEKITLGIKREGVDKLLKFEIVRGVVKVQAVRSKIYNNSYVYLRLAQFQKSVGKGLLRHLKNKKREIKKNKANLKGIILDLRSNPGGLLEEAVEVSSLFLEGGVVVSTQTRDEKNKDVHYVRKNIEKDSETPLVILINGASASASEIVAGAIQDYKRGLIIGSTSFGKGSVQSVIKVSDVSGIKLTIAQYLTPKNRKIQAVGIVPDIEIAEMKKDWRKMEKNKNRYLKERNLKNHLKGSDENKRSNSELIDDYQIDQAIKILEANRWPSL